MVNLRELAEIMDRLSKRPDDYHNQAASALMELHRLKTETIPSVLETIGRVVYGNSEENVIERWNNNETTEE